MYCSQILFNGDFLYPTIFTVGRLFKVQCSFERVASLPTPPPNLLGVGLSWEEGECNCVSGLAETAERLACQGWYWRRWWGTGGWAPAHSDLLQAALSALLSLAYTLLLLLLLLRCCASHSASLPCQSKHWINTDQNIANSFKARNCWAGQRAKTRAADKG